MKHGSLFSGIGGFDLAAQWMGWENAFHCEISEFPRKVLHHYWPNALSYENIKETDFTKWRGKIDVISGGFPCQPYSLAGKRLGKEDDRHLWPEMLRCIREIKPRWVVGENVFGIVNWDGGLVFDEVQSDLEAEGYEVQAYVLPACAVNAPHRRDRVWFVAHSNHKGGSAGCGQVQSEDGEVSEWHDDAELSNAGGGLTPNPTSKRREERQQVGGWPDSTENSAGLVNGIERLVSDGDVANAGGVGMPGQPINAETSERIRQRGAGAETIRDFRGIGQWDRFPTTQPTIRGGNDGIFTKSHGITISENRNNMDRNLVTKLCLEEGRLKVDFKTGKIYSLKQRGCEGESIELKGSDCNGYIVHGIRYNGFKIQLRAHQIVWIAANGIYDKSSFMIDHINRNKKDNRLENLRLVDAEGNAENATRYSGKLTQNQKDLMVWLHKEDGIPIRELAEDFEISKSRVHQIISEHSGIYGITFSKWRNESIKAYGNAVVPQVVYRIFKAIAQWEKLYSNS